MVLEAIKYGRGSLDILDQLQLPHRSIYMPIKDSIEAFDAIKAMNVRGAPAIAIVAALALAVEIMKMEFKSPQEVQTYITSKLDYLVKSRPTAVNLSDAAHKLSVIVENTEGDASVIAETYIAAAEKMLEDDVNDNKNIGQNGLKWAKKNIPESKFSALTICNTGSLATAGYGTALGIIRSLYNASILEHAYALETRPYNQGSRLTAYELVSDKIPATLVTDSMASFLLKSNPSIKLIVVGADRVARNGDTANKIGTYQLAIIAKHHGVKFVVAAPTTSIDLSTSTGDDIVVEQRKPEELITVKGPVVNRDGSINLEETRTVHIAAPGVNVWNPSFDITPASLIDAIVTEKYVVEKNKDGTFDMTALFKI
ncbi:hypothetical protein V1511DRAFT_497720 [Dipodascopsis uninucleata]